MGDSKQSLLNRLSICFSIIATQIRIKNRSMHLDSAKLAESLCCDLFSIAYKIPDLRVLDTEEGVNAQAIDLASKKSKVAIQVTSRQDPQKVIDALEGFKASKRKGKYTRLIICMVTGRRPNYPKVAIDKAAKGAVKFDQEKDIIDLSDVYKKISGTCKVSDLQQLVQRFEDEIGKQSLARLSNYDLHASRAYRVLEAHDIGNISAADVLKRFDINRTDLAHSELFNAKLNGDVITYLADQFAITPEWFRGESDRPAMPPPKGSNWRSGLNGCVELIFGLFTDERTTKLIFAFPPAVDLGDLSTPVEDCFNESDDAFLPFLILTEFKNDFGTRSYKLIWVDRWNYAKNRRLVYELFTAVALFTHCLKDKVDFWLLPWPKDVIQDVIRGELLLREAINDNPIQLWNYSDNFVSAAVKNVGQHDELEIWFHKDQISAPAREAIQKIEEFIAHSPRSLGKALHFNQLDELRRDSMHSISTLLQAAGYSAGSSC